MTQIHELTALELAAAVRRRELSPTEITVHANERAERLGPVVGAFITRTPDLALAQAAAVEKLVATSSPDELPPLAGVPCPIKDLTMVAGVPFTAGSAALSGYVAPSDDGVVTVLREAGTTMLGKTNTPEFGLPPYTEPDIAAPARTPWDITRTAGGSSGGAAAAVAVGIAPIAHGSDGGGSLRIPAGACGLVGFKPSRGLVSSGPLDVEGFGLSTDGALTRDVRDSAAVLDVLSRRRWPGDQLPVHGGESFLAACDEPVRQLRIGVLTTPVATADAAVHPQSLAAVDVAVELLTGLGHVVEEAPVPFPASEWDAFMAMWSVMALSAPVPPELESKLVPLTRWLRDQGTEVSGLAVFNAVAAMQRLTRQTALAWEHFDVIVCPTLAQPAAPLGSIRNDADPAGDFEAQKRFTPWSSLWNLTGGPAVSLPLHWAEIAAEGTGSAATLPFGVMFGANVGEDRLLFQLAAQLQSAAPWSDRRPPIW